MIRPGLFTLAVVLSSTACAMRSGSTTAEPVTLAVVNARVWTGDARRPWADAVAVRGDRIATVGSSAEVKKLVGADTRVVDGGGQMMVVPGLIDSHVHFLSGGYG